MSAATTPRAGRTFSSGAYLATLMAELDRAQISKRIRQARLEAGYRSQKELGDVLHVHWRTIQDWESEKSGNVPFDRLDEIARATDKSKFWLLHGREEPSSEVAGELAQQILRRLESLEDQVTEHVALTREALTLLREAQKPVAAAPRSRKKANG